MNVLAEALYTTSLFVVSYISVFKDEVLDRMGDIYNASSSSPFMVLLGAFNTIEFAGWDALPAIFPIAIE